MIKFYGLPILIAFILGYNYPYISLAVSPYAFVVLFLMMTSSALDIKWSILNKIITYKTELLVGLFFLFLFFPLVQWFLARVLVTEESLFYGTLLASLCPVAIVAPGFTKMHKGNEDLSFLLMILSMIFFPLMVWLVLTITHQTMHMRPIFIDMLILIIFPLILGEVIKKLDSKFCHSLIVKKWRSISSEFNMLAIAFLAFTYLGASVSKLNLSYTPWKELSGVLLVILFQDFGVYFIARSFLNKFFEKEIATSMTLSLSMKNLAVSGAILLFYDPKASLASALGFFVHALFFNYIVISKPKTI